MGADCVVYAGDCMAATRFQQDQDALGGVKEDDPGLSDQARVHGGIEGLLHTLRQGEVVLDLCRNMRSVCPKAIVVTLGQPVARTTQLFLGAGFQAYGLDDAAYRGNTVPRLAKALFRKEDAVEAVTAGLPGFSFLVSLREKGKNVDLIPALRQMAEEDKLGRLTHRWLGWYDAIAVGDVVRHAEFLAVEFLRLEQLLDSLHGDLFFSGHGRPPLIACSRIGCPPSGAMPPAVRAARGRSMSLPLPDVRSGSNALQPHLETPGLHAEVKRRRPLRLVKMYARDLVRP